jgi:hypothetical protein
MSTRTLLVIKTAEGRRTTPCDVSDEQYEAVRERLRELCDLCHLLEEENGEEGDIPLHM